LLLLVRLWRHQQLLLIGSPRQQQQQQGLQLQQAC
jgi:hypothetical protein